MVLRSRKKKTNESEESLKKSEEKVEKLKIEEEVEVLGRRAESLSEHQEEIEEKAQTVQGKEAGEAHEMKEVEVHKPQIIEPPEELKLKISASLYKKLSSLAKNESINIEGLAVELLAEGTVLRAFDVVERKNHRNGNNYHQNNRHYQNDRHHHRRDRDWDNRGNNRGNQRGNNRGMTRDRYFNIMDDKASFLEYVRSTEKKGR